MSVMVPKWGDSRSFPGGVSRLTRDTLYPPDWQLPSLEQQKSWYLGARTFLPLDLDATSFPPVPEFDVPEGWDGYVYLPKISFLGQGLGMSAPYEYGDYGMLVGRQLCRCHAFIGTGREFKAGLEAQNVLWPNTALRADLRGQLIELEQRDQFHFLCLPFSFGKVGYRDKYHWPTAGPDCLPLGFVQAAAILCFFKQMPWYDNFHIRFAGDHLAQGCLAFRHWKGQPQVVYTGTKVMSPHFNAYVLTV